MENLFVSILETNRSLISNLAGSSTCLICNSHGNGAKQNIIPAGSSACNDANDDNDDQGKGNTPVAIGGALATAVVMTSVSGLRWWWLGQKVQQRQLKVDYLVAAKAAYYPESVQIDDQVQINADMLLQDPECTTEPDVFSPTSPEDLFERVSST